MEKGEVSVVAPSVQPAAPPAGGDNPDKTVTAPLVGVIINISVNAGESVKSGQTLLILEALKMENEIVAPYDAVISKIHVSKNDSVNAGDPLVTLV